MPLARNSAALKRPGSNSNANLPSMLEDKFFRYILYFF